MTQPFSEERVLLIPKPLASTDVIAPTPQALFLRLHVFAAPVDDDLVVLDLARDDYLCIPGGAAHFRPARHDNACRVSGPLAEALHEAGLAQAEPGQPPQRLPKTPSRSILYDTPAALKLSDVAPLVAAGLSVRRAERREGIASQLSVVGRARRREDPAAARRAAGALWRIQPWLPFDGECLQRSMLLVAFLRELGLTADWVFGVRLWPFSAHCWVQSGDVCLNDDHERLRAYTPILCR